MCQGWVGCYGDTDYANFIYLFIYFETATFKYQNKFFFMFC